MFNHLTFIVSLLAALLLIAVEAVVSKELAPAQLRIINHLIVHSGTVRDAKVEEESCRTIVGNASCIHLVRVKKHSLVTPITQKHPITLPSLGGAMTNLAFIVNIFPSEFRILIEVYIRVVTRSTILNVIPNLLLVPTL